MYNFWLHPFGFGRTKPKCSIFSMTANRADKYLGTYDPPENATP
jgi:hypothetical protein